jgi:putative oxidoreductase
MQNATASVPAQAAKTSVLPLIASVLLALPLIIFGLNKFLGFAQMPPPAGAGAQTFLGAMFTTYLAPLVGFTEIVGGVMLLIKRTSFVGWLLLTPVVVNIAAFHIAHDMPGNGIWLVTTALYAYVTYLKRDRIAGLFN